MLIIGPKSQRLTKAETVELDGQGDGLVELGPVPPGVVWKIARLSVRCTATDPMPIANVYDGPPNDANLMDGTWTGALDTSDMGGHELTEAEYLTIRWTGGQPGATATATIVGVQTVL